MWKLVQLILLTRSWQANWQVHAVLIAFLIIWVVGLHKLKGTMMVGVILFVLVEGYLCWSECFAWRPVEPVTIVFQTTRDEPVYVEEPFRPDAQSWLPIVPGHENWASPGKVILKYKANGGSFDFEQYTYLISVGCTIEALYRHSDPDVHVGRAVHSFDCSPNDIFIYRIPYMYIVPPYDWAV